MKGRTKAILVVLLSISVIYLVGFPAIPPFESYQILLSADIVNQNIEPGINVSLTVTLTNIWFTTYLPKAGYGQKGEVFLGGLCTFDPVGFAVYRGNISISALRYEEPLNLTNPSVIVMINCPEIGFSPPIYRLNGFTSISYSSSFGGYWIPVPPYTGNQLNQTYEHIDFQQGMYSVLVENAWGAMFLIHFKVN